MQRDKQGIYWTCFISISLGWLSWGCPDHVIPFLKWQTNSKFVRKWFNNHCLHPSFFNIIWWGMWGNNYIFIAHKHASNYLTIPKSNTRSICLPTPLYPNQIPQVWTCIWIYFKKFTKQSDINLQLQNAMTAKYIDKSRLSCCTRCKTFRNFSW